MASSVETTWVKKHVGPTASVLIPQHGTSGVAHWSIEDESVFADNKQIIIPLPRKTDSKAPPSPKSPRSEPCNILVIIHNKIIRTLTHILGVY